MQLVKANEVPGWGRTNEEPAPLPWEQPASKPRAAAEPAAPEITGKCDLGTRTAPSPAAFPWLRGQMCQMCQMCRIPSPGAAGALGGRSVVISMLDPPRASHRNGMRGSPGGGFLAGKQRRAKRRMGSATQPSNSHMQIHFWLVNCFQSGRFLLISH